MVSLTSDAAGMALTHDGKLLVVTAGASVDFLDAALLISGAGNPLAGSIKDGSGAGSVYANITADDKLLFVSDESQHSITVIDLARARSNGYKAAAIVGRIPAGNAPIALTFSPDGRLLYTTSEGALNEWHWPKVCKPEGGPANAPIAFPEGAVIVVDVARAATDPAHSVVARVFAGCSPVRMAISPGGERIYVTARNSNAVLAFDTARLVWDPQHARLAMVPVGAAPAPVAVIDGGRKVVAGNSNRFAGGNTPQTLTVLDAGRMQDGAAATLGSIPAGAFPREMAVSSDGRTLFLTNFGSQSLQVIDIGNLPMVK
jgi:DNA-binding beta-propeller fold protein YncE